MQAPAHRTPGHKLSKLAALWRAGVLACAQGMARRPGAAARAVVGGAAQLGARAEDDEHPLPFDALQQAGEELQATPSWGPEGCENQS